MGVFSDWLNNQIVLGESPYIGERRLAYREIDWHRRRTDPNHHGDYTGQAEVQGIIQGAPPLTRYRLIFTMPDGTPIQTGEFLAVYTGLQWEGVVNTACAPVVPGWQDGDIAWNGGSVVYPPLVFSYQGDSVTKQNWGNLQAEVTTPPGGPLTTTTYQQGSGIRYTWSVMYELGLYGPPPPEPGDDLPEDAELLYHPDETIRWPSGSLRDKLAQQCAIEEGNSELENQLQDLFNIQQRSSVNPA
jgi:hypothetical protein